ncbi:MAG TPA: hypothetical protein VNT75_24570 [Symbiobacteriaceae bacterium]|nr:hypothetical protein [Symbiobacteriaceae bacterium]
MDEEHVSGFLEFLFATVPDLIGWLFSPASWGLRWLGWAAIAAIVVLFLISL